jgi:cation diffusion facilitator CzcD-associated flavoprotein CzcO
MATENLMQKYDEERNKRLRSDGMKQYIDLRDPFLGAALGGDPFADHDLIETRHSALHNNEKIKFLVIGAGHGGLLQASHLIKAGFKAEDIVLVDTAGGFGGTWYWNRYPGLMCDVESYIYLPLLQETGFIPKHKYSYGAEIRANAECIAEFYKLRSQFSTRVRHQAWDAEKGRWVIQMTQDLGPSKGPRELTVEAQFIFGTAAGLSLPHLPKLDGLEGLVRNVKVFHSARWDWDYTGGSQADPSMINLRGKKVGIVGTGATAIQIIPELAKWAGHLYVFQRTPSFVGPRNQRKTTHEEWLKVACKDDWQYERQDNFNSFVSNKPAPVNMVNDGWSAPDSHAYAGFLGSPSRLVTPTTINDHINSLFEMDMARGERLRARVSRIVKDENAAKKLQAWYGGWCKRPSFHDEYLDTFNRPNVTLVDTDGKGLDKYTDSGVVANGVSFDLDCLVLATGFFTRGDDTSPSGRVFAPLVGSGGVTSEQKWSSPEAGTWFGVATHGFPNAFFNLLGGSGLSYNLTSSFDNTTRLAAAIIASAHKKVKNPNVLIIEPTKQAEEEYTKEILKRALWYTALEPCTPGWFNGEGAASFGDNSPEKQTGLLRQAGWGTGILDYKRMVLEYIERDNLEGIMISSE